MQSNPFRLILKYIRHPSDTMVYIVEDVHIFGIRGFNVGGMRLYWVRRRLLGFTSLKVISMGGDPKEKNMYLAESQQRAEWAP